MCFKRIKGEKMFHLTLPNTTATEVTEKIILNVTYVVTPIILKKESR